MAQRAVLQGAGGALGTSAPPSPAQGLCPRCARPRPHPHGCSQGWQGSAIPSLPGAASCAPAGKGPPSAYLRAPSGLLSACSPQGTASPVLLLSTARWPPLLLLASSWFLHPPLFSSILLFFNLPVFSGLAIFFHPSLFSVFPSFGLPLSPSLLLPFVTRHLSGLPLPFPCSPLPFRLLPLFSGLPHFIGLFFREEA